MVGVRRFGEPGNLTVLGAGLSTQRLTYPGAPGEVSIVLDGDYGGRQPAPPSVLEQTLDLATPLDNVRGLILIGKRNVVWQQRTGLDSFRGDEDVRVGGEVELAVSRSLPSISVDNDMFLTADFYAAAGPPGLFLASRVRADARRIYDADPGEPEFREVIGQAEVLAYLQPRALARHTLLLRLAGAAGWNMGVPFQLTLGGRDALRGWSRESLPGGRRLVLTVEDRWYHPWLLPDVADIGTSLFLDVGRIWPGGSPFGYDSGVRGTLGAGLRINFPSGGRNTFRIDAGFPLSPDAQAGDFQLMIGVGEYLGVSAPFVARQLTRSRLSPVTGTLLHSGS